MSWENILKELTAEEEEAANRFTDKENEPIDVGLDDDERRVPPHAFNLKEQELKRKIEELKRQIAEAENELRLKHRAETQEYLVG